MCSENSVFVVDDVMWRDISVTLRYVTVIVTVPVTVTVPITITVSVTMKVIVTVTVTVTVKVTVTVQSCHVHTSITSR
jgi:hypothetical protein